MSDLVALNKRSRGPHLPPLHRAECASHGHVSDWTDYETARDAKKGHLATVEHGKTTSDREAARGQAAGHGEGSL